MTVLNKNEFVTAVAEGFSTDEQKMTKVDAEKLIETFTDVIEDIFFAQQKGIRLGGIGTLRPTIVPERDHRVPSTGEKITKPEHYALKFKANAALKRDLAKVSTK